MNLDIAVTASSDPVPAKASVPASTPGAGLQPFVFALFFIFGGITSLNDVVIPKLKSLFTLSYGEAMLVQSAFFAAYLVVSIPASLLVTRIGYLQGAAAGLLVMLAGCLLFVPAAEAALFPAFLAALFVLASGVTLVQVVANPLISRLGPAATAHSRLTFAQAFNSLGTVLVPYLGALLILGSLAHVDAAHLAGEALRRFRNLEGGVVARTYVGLAIVLALVAAAVWSQRNRLAEARPEAPGGFASVFRVLRLPRVAAGAGCIFLYVGVEVAVGSMIVSYLMQPSVMGLSQLEAGKHVPFYWGGMMLGRFAGAYILRLARPGRVLAAAGAAAMLMLLIAGRSHGAVGGYALLAVGLCNSIMFPTIFTLACEGLAGEAAADASGVICVSIVGGAVLPPLTGHIADLAGLRTALVLPGACYLLIVLFGLWTAAGRRAGAAPEPAPGSAGAQAR